jgi:hypothetical protein
MRTQNYRRASGRSLGKAADAVCDVDSFKAG